MAEKLCIKMGGGATAVSIVSSGSGNVAVNNSISISIPVKVEDGMIFVNWTRDSDQAMTNMAITSGTATVETEQHGKYQYTNAYIRTYAIRIKNVSANSTFTCKAGASGSACFFTYAVCKFS